jgi:hypothetical protein
MVGETCDPNNPDVCPDSFPCRLNLWGVPTCGGVDEWRGNHNYIIDLEVKISHYDTRWYLVIIGMLLLLLAFAYFLYKHSWKPDVKEATIKTEEW